jgi:hypothetical protein
MLVNYKLIFVNIRSVVQENSRLSLDPRVHYILQHFVVFDRAKQINSTLSCTKALRHILILSYYLYVSFKRSHSQRLRTLHKLLIFCMTAICEQTV